MSHTYDPINTSPRIEMTSPILNSTFRPSPSTQTSSNNLSHSNSATTLLPHEQDHSHFESQFHNPEQSFTTVPYESKSGKQFWHILLKSLAQWLITLVLCVAYYSTLTSWHKKGTVTERDKRIFNAITTGFSIALGINITSSLKSMALDARWAILHASKRNLCELDLTLHADSLMSLGKWAFVSKRPMVFGMAISWLIFNIFVQAAIAAISLTYGFDTSTNSYILTPGNVTIPDLKQFSKITKPRIEDEQITAHTYGGLAWELGIGNSSKGLPRPGEIYRGLTNNYSIWQDDPNNKMVFVLAESSSSASSQKSGLLSVYTNRTLEMHYSCFSYIAHLDNETKDFYISNPDIHFLQLNRSWAPNAINFYTDDRKTCDDNPRCSIIKALETSDIETDTQWYYTCNITLSQTLNDEKNISYISNRTSQIAAGAIANTGYLQETSSYSQKTIWGTRMNGNASGIGIRISSFGLTSLSVAAAFGPSKSYSGDEPHTGFTLLVKHMEIFLVIVFLIPLLQLIMCLVVAVWSNSVQVGDDAYIGMSLLLRPITDALLGVSRGLDNGEFKEAKKRIMRAWEGEHMRI
ncbi:hypothetical protein BHYA_0254g00010 [Botrytis hyacinthi]|uniref:Uncharacterized protein n=1 Tax=Botrytis hyacinthi TaxID=278943 RepID=A0A4Z1G8L4_9HELO|nr:hypothetical protein BHYA_0254g00010 [Botrytis hyacinthi]